MVVQMPATGSSANAVARHIDPEPFRVFAAAQIEASPPWERGVCFNAACSAAFTPARDWQMYCCRDCERAGVAEQRRWGHRMALPLLVWRMGKYEERDEGLRDLTRAARRYVAHAQSAWLAERRDAAAGAAVNRGAA